jgi:MFS family permease
MAGVALILCSVANQLWQLFLLYGIIVSLGVTGAANVTITALITRWFTAKRGLALGISMSGMAVAQLVVVPLALYLVSHFNWRYSIGILGVGVLFVFMPLMLLFIRSKPTDLGLISFGEVAIVAEKEDRIEQVQLKEKQEPVWTVLKQRVFWQLAIPYFVCGFTDVGLVDTHYIPFAEGEGFSIGVIAFTFSLIAIANIIGTIGTGYLADRWNRSRLLAMIYGIRGLTFVLLLVANKPWLLAVFAVFYGITEMASIAPTSSLCVYLFNKYSIGVIFGFVSVSHQLGGAIGSFVPGVIYDLTHSYVLVFLLSIILITISALVVSRVPDSQGQKA